MHEWAASARGIVIGVALTGVVVGLVACDAGATGSAETRGPTALPKPSSTPVSGAPGSSAASATAPESGSRRAALRWVALGDSYTIGTSVRGTDRWPDQLVRTLDGRLDLVANLGVNGYTSGDVIERELPQLDALAPQFVTLLIGVNDVVQGVPEPTYRANVTRILDRLVAIVPANRLVAISTPDYTVTPQGASFGDPAQQAAGIRRNNDILRELATARGIAFVDIYDISLRAAADRTLVAGDGLHPSATQYGLWVDRMAPVVSRLLGDAALGYP